MDIVASILASILTLIFVFLSGRYYRRWKAIKKLGKTFFDAMADDDCTPDEAKAIIRDGKALFSDKKQ